MHSFILGRYVRIAMDMQFVSIYYTPKCEAYLCVYRYVNRMVDRQSFKQKIAKNTADLLFF